MSSLWHWQQCASAGFRGVTIHTTVSACRACTDDKAGMTDCMRARCAADASPVKRGPVLIILCPIDERRFSLLLAAADGALARQPTEDEVVDHSEQGEETLRERDTREVVARPRQHRGGRPRADRANPERASASLTPMTHVAISAPPSASEA